MNQAKTDQCIETLCQRGCAEVLNIIRALERGESLPELLGLDPLERRTVLQELKAIMAVYESKGWHLES